MSEAKSKRGSTPAARTQAAALAAEVERAAERAATAVDLSAPPEELGPAIPLFSVQCHGPVDCVGPCANQATVRIRPGGANTPFRYRIDLLPRINQVRIYSFSAFVAERLESPEVFVPMSYVKTYKVRHADEWFAERLEWVRNGGPEARNGRKAPDPEDDDGPIDDDDEGTDLGDE